MGEKRRNDQRINRKGAPLLVTFRHTAPILQFSRVFMSLLSGVSLKFHEPPESRKPLDVWKIYVFKGEEVMRIF
jgi:hypothetical protein